METDPRLVKFTSRSEFEALWRELLLQTRSTLLLFDPDFAVVPLGASDVDAVLRRFLQGGGTVRLALHRPQVIERDYPRFLQLLKDYNHRIECRATARNLHQLTDSFSIGDRVNIVRRYHSDHLRGEAAFGLAEAADISQERFDAIWAESAPTLHPTTTGL